MPIISTAVAWLTGSRLGRYASIAIGIILAIVAARFKWRADGASDARADAREADMKGAENVRKKADHAAAESGRDKRTGLERMRDDHPENFIDGPSDQP
jgi:hypothetical protein